MSQSTLRTPAEAAARFQVPLKTIYAWSSTGRIPSLKVGRHLRFRDGDLDAFERSCEKPARDAR
jgi:excisionase family DNA binding protein